MIAYISRVHYPDPAANSLQTMRMAAALAQQVEPTCLFVHDLSAPAGGILQQYGVQNSTLQIWPLRTRRWPARVYQDARLRFLAYNSAVAAILSFHRRWRGSVPSERQPKVLFVRSRLETLYWGLMRTYLWGLRGWLFACEIHDLPEAELGQARRMAKALHSYDLVISVNQALAEDISRLTQGEVLASVVPLCTGIPRLPAPPTVSLDSEQVVIGYFGTVDLAHGIDTVLKALDLLPNRFVLRIFGRIREDALAFVQAAAKTGRVEQMAPVPYAQVAAEIDACQIAIAPAGSQVHSSRYRSPLKIFDYMARGKPILAADVPCHREILCDGETAVFFVQDDPQDLARKIEAAAQDPARLNRLARAAWETSRTFTYEARAQTLLKLIERTHQQKVQRKRKHG